VGGRQRGRRALPDARHRRGRPQRDRRRHLPPAPQAPGRRRRGGVVAGALRAFGLGLLHGPAELLPISSSAHAALLTQDLDGERRKELEVALHAGTLAAIGLPRPSVWLAVATLPPAVAGALLEKPIEQRLGTPTTTAAGLLAGGIAMALADEKPGTEPFFSRRRGEKGSVPGLSQAVVLGFAQAAALVPGVSRHGAALTALRAMGFARPRAHAISREASRPVLLGAAVLKGVRVAQRAEGLWPLVAAAAGSALSTRVAARALEGRGVRAPLWPFALYRAALAASVRGMARQPVPVSGRVIAITGGARGIGRALAAELQRRGAKVAIGDIDADAVEQTGHELGVLTGALDVTDRDSFSAFLDRVEHELGPLDVLVNNAGIAPLGRFADEPDEVTRRVLAVNLLGPALGSKLAMARMLPRRRGHIVNVASGAGRFAVPGLTTYSATKSGVIGLTDTLRMELMGTGVGVSMVLPGPVETDMIAGTRRTRKLQVIEPADAARMIADGIERPRHEIWAPRQNDALHRLTAPFGTPFRQWVSRRLDLHRMYTETDAERREAIERRMRAHG
jgi:NAD(P)-dependent dehydrogenase (short-subunit alcohol dehydrogenase family)/undecaprenyl pyrophosphate phosphatase UppP